MIAGNQFQKGEVMPYCVTGDNENATTVRLQPQNVVGTITKNFTMASSDTISIGVALCDNALNAYSSLPQYEYGITLTFGFVPSMVRAVYEVPSELEIAATQNNLEISAAVDGALLRHEGWPRVFGYCLWQWWVANYDCKNAKLFALMRGTITISDQYEQPSMVCSEL